MSVLTILASFVVLQGASQAAEIVRVKVKQANLRSGPGTHYEKTWSAPMNYPYRVVQRKGAWLKVRDFSNYEDWIYAPLTDKKPAVVIKVKQANVRQDSGTNHDIVFTAYRGVPFLVLEKKGEWLKVRHEDGDEGWVFGRLVWGAANVPTSQERSSADRGRGSKTHEVEGAS